MCARSKCIIPRLLKKINSLGSSEHVWLSDDSIDQGPRSHVIKSSDVIELIARESLKMKLLLLLVVFLLCIVLCT